MSTAVVPVERLKKAHHLIASWKNQIAAALPAHITADRMARLVMIAIEKNPKLMDCTQTSLVGSIMQASQLGLEIGGHRGQAHLIPYEDSKSGKLICQFIPGYLGLVDIARRSGQVSTIMAACAYANEELDYERGLNERLIHKPKLTNRGPLVAAYAVCLLRDGRKQWDLMTKDEIEHCRKSSKARKGPWFDNYDEMCKKTVLRRLCKLLPFSVEVQRDIELTEHADDVNQDPGNVLDASWSEPLDDGNQGEAPDDVNQDPAETVDPQKVPAAGTLEEILAQARPRIAASKSDTELQEIDAFFQHDSVKQLCKIRSEEIHSARGSRSNNKTTAGA